MKNKITKKQLRQLVENKVNETLSYMNRRAIIESYVRKELKKQLTESEYTADKLASDQDDFAYQNGYKGSFIEDVTFIEFNNGEKYELDDFYDDLESIKQYLASKGAREGVDYKVVTKPVSRHWSI